MKQSLQLKVSQSLTLTPQLQQSIRLLQLSTLELQQEIQQALADNPMLELADEETSEQDNTVRLESNGEMIDSAGETRDEAQDARLNSAPESPSETNEDYSLDRDETVLRESIDSIADNWEGDWRDNSGGTTPDGDEEKPGLQLAAPESSLASHLIDQLRMTKASERDINLVLWLIDYLSDDGYLTVELEDLWDTLKETPDLEFEELTAALKLLQSFDPPGVGARNASECLLLQLALKKDDLDATHYEHCCQIVREHLNLLAQRDFSKIKKALDIDDAQLKRCHEQIRMLDPFPGARFRRIDDDHVIPDVIVRKNNGQWTVQLNPEVMPKIRINEVYASILRSHRGQTSQLSAQLQEARWLLKNVQQRFDTILRVSQAIVERQIGYFNHGEIAMQPLVLREIADLLGLHESTVSRVTTQKYMLTPYGLVELKYFFGSHVSTDSGGQASSTAIRALIKQLVSAEDPKQPISDSQIAELLGQQGIVVARRTVAKYREALKIPPVNMRKSL